MGETLNMIAQASNNEIDTGLSGAMGDQKGSELNAVKWYSYPWDRVFRAKDTEVAEKIADFMEKAVANGYIGYDNNTVKRHILFQNLSEIGFKVEELEKPSLCDCSSLGYCAIYNAIGVEFTPTQDANGVQNSPKSSMYQDYLMTQCEGYFDMLNDEAYLLSPNNLVRGDILVNDTANAKHVAVWI